MANWIGFAVSVNCGEPLGSYQGTILEANGSTLTLTKAFRNGFPYPEAKVTLNAADIKELKIIEPRSEPAEQPHSTVAVTKISKRGPRATVCENLQANPSSSGNQGPVAGGSKSAGRSSQSQPPIRSKPIDIQPKGNKNNSHTGSYGGSGSTPKGRGSAAARRRNEACFGGDAAPARDEFDFEGNLALFDKQALWEQMRLAHKPDLVRQADEVGKFRHDENVLGGPAQESRRAIRVPDALRGPLDYVTDDGVLVPALSGAARRRLWEGVWRAGVGEAAVTLLGRAVADVALRLVGGGRRLETRNAHQTPVIVTLAGMNTSGAAGAVAARLLAAHGARCALSVCGGAGADAGAEAARRALAAAAAAGVDVCALERLPGPDLVLLALHDDAQEAAAGARAWLGGARAAVVAVEPAERGAVSSRAAVCALLPAALPPTRGRVFLANVAPPLAIFSEQRIAYRPPFGASAVLALHAADA